MKLIEPIRHRIKGLLSTPLDELGSWAKFFRYQIQVWGFCFRRLRENNAMAMSAALSFRTIFAMIPVLVLSFLMVRSMGVMDEAHAGLQELLDRVGLTKIAYEQSDSASATQPDQPQQITVAQKIEDVVTNVESQLTVGRLGPVGVALLVWTALTLLTTIERSLNRIFGAMRDRKFAHRILSYWSALTLGPIILMLTLFIAKKASSAVENIDTLSWLVKFTGQAGSFIVAIIVLAWFYRIIPNTFVRFDAALGGALIAIPLWLFARWGFALYVSYVGKQSIYGALGLLPLFLLWMNLSWWIFLFGAQLAHSAASVFSTDFVFDETKPSPWTRLAGLIVIAKNQSTGPVSVNVIAEQLGMPVSRTYEILTSLIETNDACRVSNGDTALFVLAKPADKISTMTVMESSFDASPASFSQKMHKDIRTSIQTVRQKMNEGIGTIKLSDLV